MSKGNRRRRPQISLQENDLRFELMRSDTTEERKAEIRKLLEEIRLSKL